ncbi:MAG: hypothetical protein IJ897_05870 [Prevotella sp.]|nr:hypothetical protein [Prevotella sp.]
MKKTYNYIIAAAIILTSMLQLVSCKDSNNDWTTDPSVIQQRPPSSLTIEVDSATLDMSIQIGTIAKAAYYELQMSESPLTSNEDIPVEGTVYTINNITEDQFVDGKISIKRQNEYCEFKEDHTYYFRVRAIGQDGTISNWYTNGMLYSGDIGNAQTAKRMTENTYCMVETPSILWIDDSEIDPDALTTRWHETDYITVAKIRNETTNVEHDVSEATKDTDYTKVKVWYYKWEGLEVNKAYTFSLLDAAGNVIKTITQSTEYAPNMSLAHSILAWKKEDVIGAKGESKVVYDPDNYFSITFNEESAANSNYVGPSDNKKYYCQTPDKKVYISNYRVQVKNTNTLEVKVPESGRLYLYANGSPTTYEVSKFIGKDDDDNDQWERIQKVTVKKDDKTPIQDEGGSTRQCYKFAKLKLSGAVDGRYKIAPTASKSCYYYGFVFVPDDPNAGQE